MRLQRAARLEALLAVSARKRPRMAAVRQAVIQQVLDTTLLRRAAGGVTTVNNWLLHVCTREYKMLRELYSTSLRPHNYAIG